MKSLHRILFATVVALYFIANQGFAQDPDRYALVVGVTGYDKPELNTGLKFPENDAIEIAKVFRAQGYSVDLLLGKQATQQAIRERLAKFSKRGDNGGVVFVSLCGHGVEFTDPKQSYFCPYNSRLVTLRDADGKVLFDPNGKATQTMDTESLISIDEVLIALGDSQASNRVLVADCCRDDPTRARGRSFGSSLKTDKLPLKTLLLLSCSEQERSFEHDAWNHGALTKCLLTELRKVPESQKTMGSVAEDVLPAVGKLIRTTIGNNESQTPRLLSTGRVELLFDKVTTRPTDNTAHSLPTDLKNSLGMQLKLIPAGDFLMGSQHTTDELKKLGFAVEFDSNNDERPQHSVRISKPFYMGVHEVTLGQFLEYYNSDRENHKTDAERDGKGGSGLNLSTGVWSDQQASYVPWNTGWNQPVEKFMNHPVVNVSWSDAMAFCKWLTEKERKAGKIEADFEYLLPTEAQWEYACRGGSRVARIFYFGNDPKLLSYFANIGDRTAKIFFESRNMVWEQYHPGEDGHALSAPVGSYDPNNYGLYDMHGNVQEWCLDGYSEDAYATRTKNKANIPTDPLEINFQNFVFRGGAWQDNEWSRTSDRRWNDPWMRGDTTGFRVALVRKDSIDLEKRRSIEYVRLALRGIQSLDQIDKQSELGVTRKQLSYLILQLETLKDPTEGLKLEKVRRALNEMGDDLEATNAVCWRIVEAMEPKSARDKIVLDHCEKHLSKAMNTDAEFSKASVMDTLAHLQFLQGRTNDAIKTQKEAISIADEAEKATLKEHLKKFEKASKL